MLPYTLAYLFADMVIGFPMWLFLFLFRPDLRHRMIIFGIIGAIGGPISEYWYIRDYWHPLTITGWPISIEDVIFGFFVGGIGCVMYEEIFGKRIAKRHKRQEHWILLVFPAIAGVLFLFNRLFPAFHINSIYASAIAFVGTAGFILYTRKDLMQDALMSAVLGGLIFLIGYSFLLYFFPQIFQRMWLLSNISGITLNRIPMEEILWAFTYGLMVGPLYECYAGLAFQKREERARRRR